MTRRLSFPLAFGRCASRRSGLLRTEPCFAVSALREPAAIAIGAEYDLAPTSPTGEAGAPNLSTLFPLFAISLAVSTFAASFIMGASM